MINGNASIPTLEEMANVTVRLRDNDDPAAVVAAIRERYPAVRRVRLMRNGRLLVDIRLKAGPNQK